MMGIPNLVENDNLNVSLSCLGPPLCAFFFRSDGLVTILDLTSHGPQRSNLTSLHI